MQEYTIVLSRPRGFQVDATQACLPIWVHGSVEKIWRDTTSTKKGLLQQPQYGWYRWQRLLACSKGLKYHGWKDTWKLPWYALKDWYAVAWRHLQELPRHLFRTLSVRPTTLLNNTWSSMDSCLENNENQAGATNRYRHVTHVWEGYQRWYYTSSVLVCRSEQPIHGRSIQSWRREQLPAELRC